MSVRHDIARTIRRIPVAGDLIARGDPRRRAERIAATGVIDPTTYLAQYPDASIDRESLALDYTSRAYYDGATVNVLIDPDVLDRNLRISGRPIIYDYLHSRAWEVPTSRWWSAPDYLQAHPEAGDHPAGPVGHLWDRLRTGAEVDITIDGNLYTGHKWPVVYDTLVSAGAEWMKHRLNADARRPDELLAHAESLHDRFPAHKAHPKISVVLPVRNRANGLRSAVASLREQTWRNWELIVVDDGSWDDTLTILDVVEQTDRRVHVLRRTHEGVSAARNAGIAAATGEYVAFLDSDNTWRPRFLEDMMTAMTASASDAGHATIKSISESGVVYRQRATTYERLLDGNTVDLNTLVVRRDVLHDVGGFDTSLRRAVDYDLILRLSRRMPLEHVPTVGAYYDNLESSGDRISTSEPLGWNIAVRLRHLAEIHSQVDDARLAQGGTTYLVCLPGRSHTFEQMLDEVTALADHGESEVLLVVVDPGPSQWRLARVRALTHSIRPFLVGTNPLSFLVNAHLPYARNEHIIIVGLDAVVDAASLRTLGDAVRSGVSLAAMPLGLNDDGTLHGVGSAFTRSGALPTRALAGHPREDAEGLSRNESVPHLTGSVLALRTADLRAAGGLDPLLYNAFEAEALSDRLREVVPDIAFVACTEAPIRYDSKIRGRLHVDLEGSRRVITKSRRMNGADALDAIYRKAGLRVDGTEVVVNDVTRVNRDGKTVVIDRVAEPHLRVRAQRADGAEAQRIRLRWAIKTASPAGPAGERWGDTHFARSLASALRDLGQDVVVDAREAVHRHTAYLDDVTVVLRGLDEVTPDPAQLSYLWVISHPDMVTRTEADSFDRVFAASLAWSSRTEQRWGIAIEPLLQCTDPHRFVQRGTRRSGDVLFVGNSRGVPRAVVLESVRAGIDVKLYGDDWERFIPAESVLASHVDNANLSALYESASVVLNDHWSDMQREGFFSNRLFDVVAAGGRALSDYIEGIDEVFGGAVKTYRSVSEIADLLSGNHDSLFVADDDLATISARVREEHSFRARARVLLERAQADLGRTSASGNAE